MELRSNGTLDLYLTELVDNNLPKKILQYPHPSLRMVCEPVEEINEFLLDQIKRMFHLMIDSNGLGLAANQVGINKRFFIVNHPEQGKFAFINPTVSESKGNVYNNEACLSLLGVFGKVRRAKTVRVQAFNINAESIDQVVSGSLAQIVQHEIDHLNGILFTDRMTSLVKKMIGLKCQRERFPG